MGVFWGAMDAIRELEGLWKEGTFHFSLQLLADGRFEIRYGDYLRNADFHGYADTFDDAVAFLKKAVESQQPRRVG